MDELLFAEDLIYLQLTRKIELRITGEIKAANLGVRLFVIRGVTYGFLKVV